MRRVRVMAALLGVALFLFGHALVMSSPARLLAAEWEHALASAGPRAAVEGSVERPMGAGWVLTDVKSASGKALPGKLLVRGFSALPALAVGDRIAVEGIWAPVDGRRNPKGFDFKNFLRANGIFAAIKAQKAVLVERESGFSFQQSMLDLRRKLLDRIQRSFDPDTAAFAAALFAGARTTLEPSFKQALIDTSTMHIFAISGLHIALILGWLMAATLFLARFSVLRAGWVCVVLCLYCALVGSQPPVLRATLMACVYLAAFVLLRRPQSWNALGLAGIVILMVNPEELFGAGFQLSFTAVGGLLWISPQFFDLEAWRASKTGGWAEQTRFYFLGLAVVCVLAWVVTMPLTVHYFYHVHLLSAAVNFLVLPLTFVMLGLLLVWSLLFWVPDAWLSVLTVPVRWCSDASMWCIEWFDRMELFSWNAAPWHGVTLIVFIGALAAMAVFKSRMRYPVRLVAMVLLALNCLLMNQAVVIAATPPFTMTALDVGQGDALLFEFAGGRTLLVDTGRKENGNYVIAPYLRSRGKQKIDALVVSHPQLDHSGAVEDLVRHFDVGAVLDNGDRNPAGFYRDMMKTIEEERVPHATLRTGDRLQGFKDIDIEVLHPEQGMGEEELNNASLCMMIRYAGRNLLLTGDLEEEGVVELLSSVTVDDVDVLKVPHHGALLHENGLRLLRQSDPGIAVISVGKTNRYGHPHPETMKMLEAMVPEVRRTDRDGAVTVRINKNGEITTEKMV